MAFVLTALLYFGVGLALLQVVQGLGFAWRLRRCGPVPPLSPEPRTLVVLCLRGADPFLSRCLHGLFRQDYSNYEVLIVVDRREDDAWQIATDVVSASGVANVRIETLRDRSAACSLKCSALLQAWEEAVERFEVAAMIDADVVPHRTWLRELVAGLAPSDVGAACGNRWYMPDDAGIGSLTRYFWNAAAVVPMYWYGIAWGGSLAVKTAVLRDTEYRRRTARALSEDVMLCDLLRPAKLRVAFVPQLMMINREACTIRDFYPWMRRQQLLAKLYHSRAPLIMAYGIVVGVYLIAVSVVSTMLLLRRDYASLMQTVAPFLAFLGSLIVVWPMLEGAVRSVVRLRGEPTSWLSGKKLLLTIAAGPIAQALYVAATVSLLRCKEIHWRAIRYRISGPWEIERLDDGVYRSTVDPKKLHSL